MNSKTVNQGHEQLRIIVFYQYLFYGTPCILSVDSLENKQELPVKARALAEASLINIAMLSISKH